MLPNGSGQGRPLVRQGHVSNTATDAFPSQRNITVVPEIIPQAVRKFGHRASRHDNARASFCLWWFFLFQTKPTGVLLRMLLGVLLVRTAAATFPGRIRRSILGRDHFFRRLIVIAVTQLEYEMRGWTICYPSSSITVLVAVAVVAAAGCRQYTVQQSVQGGDIPFSEYVLRQWWPSILGLLWSGSSGQCHSCYHE